MGTTIFVLKGAKQPRTWAIGQKIAMAIKKGDDHAKYINYYKGHESIFVEDYEDKKDIKPTRVPYFMFNPATNRTELLVNNTDKNLIQFLKSHPAFGKKYELTSSELEAEKAVSNYDKVGEALDIVRESDNIKAAAVAILGFDCFSLSEKECEAKLKQKAFKEPEQLIAIAKSKKFTTREIAALAYCNGIIKNNASATSVVWGDTGKGIINVATGEDPLDKITNLLSQATSESVTLLQEISKKVDKKATVTTKTDKSDSNKDKKIADLEAQLEALKAAQKNTGAGDTGLTLEDATAEYENKFSKAVPTKYKNDLEYITSKLTEDNA